MSRRTLYFLGGTVGSVVGGFIPNLWGAGDLSMSSLLLGTLGGVAGIILAYRLASQI